MTSKFEDRLWTDLVREHAAAIHLLDNLLVAPRARRRRPLLLAGAAAGAGVAVAAGVAVTIALGSGSTPAFALTSNANGTVTVTIHDIAGVAGANAELERLGVRARAVPFVAGCTSAAPRVPADTSAGPLPPSSAVNVGGESSAGHNLVAGPGPHGGAVVPVDSGAVTIDPNAIPLGQTLVLAARETSHSINLGVISIPTGHSVALGVGMVDGPAPACLPVPTGDRHRAPAP